MLRRLHAFYLRLPLPVQLFLPGVLGGFVIATLLVGALLWSNFGGIGQLMLRSREHPIPVLLLWFFLGLSASSVQIGIAVMGMKKDD
ncbi:hypothetical protein [Rhodovarius lipocyclicus]|uniref:hypothetical protein n=1 Tax=Rhodovarius lipocyclicus TaxID=268410 RepID=UPI001359307D|nr:hypothetical protein [Rhodovarius lipocyclicus]